MKTELASERSVIVYHDEPIGAQTTAQLQYLGKQIKSALGEQLLDLVQSYQSLLVIFNPRLSSHPSVIKIIEQCIENLPTGSMATHQQLVRLPVYYHEEVGPDLERIASHHKLTIEQVIERHCSQAYQVYAIGFAPGFAYLGEVASDIAMPRLKSPRPKVAKGSVGIADQQTAIYPAASPGGWNLIGRCPIELFNPEQTPAMPFNVGDNVQFSAINKDEFINLGGIL
ncbi:5-oxoprolinase subunit PxpB [Reinekea thalattae]|uniref:5-oxoprolinase subunit PxpB n=1 Tax=Reinekea thalattae TaxID=2593301 RepID=A0A5C8YZW5_9GAMM|nr:5-oxoprolinase subunit PxpB [Reinekea thalattae]TXR51422.1 5-oxoprolinase subunit PxpB [Reinekea thalattae]